MSKLKWDNTGERFYETGIRRGVIYPEVNGVYPAGYVWNGLTSVSESPSGAEANAIYADDIKYLELRSAEELGATVEAYMYPDEFAACDGTAVVADGVMIGQQTRKKFGLSYRTILGNDVDGDDKGYKLHLIYGATASPSERQYQTVNDSPEAISFSWEMTTTPLSVKDTNGNELIDPSTGRVYKPTASIVIDSTKADQTKLAELEEILYGTDNTDARLPLPGEVIEIMGGTVAADIHLNKGNISLRENKTYRLVATTIPSDATVTYTSSSTSVATVGEHTGVVTGVAAGSATITATITVDGTNYTDTCAVTVTAAS